MNWKKSFTYKSARFVEAKVGDETIRFYPNQLGILQSLAELSEPITKAINQLTGAEGRNYKTETKTTTEGGFSVEETVIGATDLESQRDRIRQREEGIAQLVKMIGDGRNLRLIGKAWMDSMKDIFPRQRGGADTPEIEEFLYGDDKPTDDPEKYEGLDVPQMVQIATGWLKANAKVFGDVGEKVVGYVRGQMESRLQNVSTSQPEEETDPTSGEDSRTPSSPQLVSDSNSES